MAFSSGAQTSPTPKTAPSTFRNPLKADGADPWMTYHEGWYYLATTSGGDVRLRRARHLAELKNAAEQIVWRDGTPSRNRHIWAPEFHLLESGQGLRWYLYFTASDDDDTHHRMYVVESLGTDILGPYFFKAGLQTDPKNEFYAIDGTILKGADGALFFLWCGRPVPEGQGLFISRMTNPWTLKGERVHLEASGFGCPYVREGPAMLRRGGKIFLVYSFCDASTANYQLGMLVADEKSDPMNPASWVQHPTPVFQRNDAGGVFGSGHNFFFQSPDGKEDWIVYHAKTGSKPNYTDRSTRAQKFTWNADGTPNFGAPLPLDSEIPAPSGE